MERTALAPASSLGAVKSGEALGATLLYDAIAVAVTTPLGTDRRQMAIVFTDGVDTMSFLDEASVPDVARHSRTAIFLVATSSHGSAGRDAFFARLAETTGGTVQVVQPFAFLEDQDVD